MQNHITFCDGSNVALRPCMWGARQRAWRGGRSEFSRHSQQLHQHAIIIKHQHCRHYQLETASIDAVTSLLHTELV
jgi:hypothetical protein